MAFRLHWAGRLGSGKRQGPVEFPRGSPIQLAKDELPIPVKVEFDAYYLKNNPQISQINAD